MASRDNGRRVEKLKSRRRGMFANEQEETSFATAVLQSLNTVSTRTPRGRTQLDVLVKDGVQGKKKDVSLNKIGQPIGPNASTLQSYIGVLAREKISIAYKSWKQVPEEDKDLIWESVNMSFNIDPSWRKDCLTSASQKWRQFKTHLTQKFISSKSDNTDELKEPPKGYCIKSEEWKSFVISRMSDEFAIRSAEQKERRKKHLYPHRLSRKGYARFVEEIAEELCDDDEINRAIIWKKGRVSKEGEVEGDDLKKAIEKIDDYIQQKQEGKMESQDASNDILSLALDTQDHSGRVRVVGGHVTPSVYFNVGRKRRNSDVDQTIIAQHKTELMDAKILISSQEARISKQDSSILKQDSRLLELEARIEKLEKMLKKSADNFDSDVEGSCSMKMVEDHDVQNLTKSNFYKGDLIALRLDSRPDIVAYGTIIDVNGAGKSLHGTPIPVNCMRVSIDIALQKSVYLPWPIQDECDTVGDAVGTHVAWPVHLVVMRDEIARKKKTIEEKKNLTLTSNMPRSLRMLLCYTKVALEDGRNIPIVLDHDMFDDDVELHVHQEDIVPFCQLEPISGNCIVVYMWYLYKKLKKDNKVEKYRFVNPHMFPYLSHVISLDKNAKVEHLNTRASLLADRLSGASVNEVVFVPSNVGFHWVLFVIDPYKKVVFLLDPIGCRSRNEDWIYVIEMALKLFNSNKKRKGRKYSVWEFVKGPRQPDSVQCGYYVMKYMRDIIENGATSDKDSIKSTFKETAYSQEEIDVVRAEWAECIQDHIY